MAVDRMVQWADEEQRREAARAVVSRMLSRGRDAEYINRTLAVRLGLEGEAAKQVWRDVLEQWERADEFARTHRRSWMRAILDRYLERALAGKVSTRDEGQLVLGVIDKLCKLDALYLSDHLKAMVQQKTMAAALSDADLEATIRSELAKRAETLGVTL